MAAFVLDTGVLVRHLRNRPGFQELLEGLAREGDLFIASFTRLEIARGMRDHESERTLSLLNGLITHPLDIPTADRAGALIREQLARRRAIVGPDAIIAATGLILDAAVVTTNPRHFAFQDLKVYRVDERAVMSSL